jgi:hypothetical protein
LHLNSLCISHKEKSVENFDAKHFFMASHAGQKYQHG